MPLNRKAFALLIGLIGPVSVATIAGAQGQRAAEPQTLDSQDATIDWFQQSNVSALRPGVIDKMEVRIGKTVDRDGVIGVLYKKSADLSVREAEIQANSQGEVQKAQAQKRLAAAVIGTNEALNKRLPNSVSREEMQKAEAEFLVAKAAEQVARDTQDLAKAKLDSAKQTADEHTIKAPFSGIVIEEFKHEGESVQANEAVIRLGNLDKVRVWTYIPLEYSYRVAVGTEIEVQLRFGNRLHQKKHRGVVTFVDPSVQPIGESGIRVYAEIDNPTHELQPGHKATMRFFLKPESANPATASTVGGASGGLPALPR